MLSNGIKWLEWDSEFFGIKIGKLEVDRQISQEELREIAQDYNLVYLFSEVEQAEIPENELLDIKVNSILDYSHQNLRSNQNISKVVEPRHESALNQLVVQNGLHSRFYLDEELRPKYDAMYLKWGKNCLNTNTNHTWFYEEDNKLLGFITVTKDDRNQIELCTVNPAFRSQGIARKLWLHAFEELSKTGPIRFNLCYQAKNKIAKTFYESLGFSEVEKWFVYHLR